MPQFEFGHFIPQMVWLALVFAVLYFLVVTPTLPKIGRVVQAREDKISGDIAAAEQAKHLADSVAADYATQMAAAHERARAAIVNAKASAASSLAAELDRADSDLHAKIEAAQATLETARNAALAEIGNASAETAADMVEKLTGARPSSAAAAAATSAALQRN